MACVGNKMKRREFYCHSNNGCTDFISKDYIVSYAGMYMYNWQKLHTRLGAHGFRIRNEVAILHWLYRVQDLNAHLLYWPISHVKPLKRGEKSSLKIYCCWNDQLFFLLTTTMTMTIGRTQQFGFTASVLKKWGFLSIVTVFTPEFTRRTQWWSGNREWKEWKSNCPVFWHWTHQTVVVWCWKA